MTARQQIARLIPVALFVVLAIAGLRGGVTVPRWNGPLRGDGVAIGLALEVVFGVLLVITTRRHRDALGADAGSPAPSAEDIDVAAGLGFVLRMVLVCAMVAIAVVLIVNLHLHFFTKAHLPQLAPKASRTPPFRRLAPAGNGEPLHVPWGPILYGLVITALLAAVVLSIWWAARLRRVAVPGPVPRDIGEDSEGLRDAVESGRAALATQIDDARAAIIACYLAMERTLAKRGTARAAADTPDELLARAVTSGIVRGTAARRLTALFYEARFSSHPLGPGQRDAASRALDDLAAGLSSAQAVP